MLGKVFQWFAHQDQYCPSNMSFCPVMLSVRYVYELSLGLHAARVWARPQWRYYAVVPVFPNALVEEKHRTECNYWFSFSFYSCLQVLDVSVSKISLAATLEKVNILSVERPIRVSVETNQRSKNQPMGAEHFLLIKVYFHQEVTWCEGGLAVTMPGSGRRDQQSNSQPGT